MSEPAVVNLSLARLARIEQSILTAEHSGLRGRWEFGHELLAHANEKGNLPHRFVKEAAAELNVEPAEINRRKRFAQRYPTEADLDHAMITFGSWYAVVNRGLKADDEEEPSPGDAQLPEGVYRTIVADPPWQYANKATRGAAEDHYGTLSLDQLTGVEPLLWKDGTVQIDNLAVEVHERAADEAHLYLWTTNGFLRDAFDVMEAWGFTYKTTLTWVKPQIGMGNYFRSSTEHVLFGVRGGLRTLDGNQRNWFEAPRGRHSKKPGLFFDLVERVSPGPYLEMFARERRLGDWDVWGNEV